MLHASGSNDPAAPTPFFRAVGAEDACIDRGCIDIQVHVGELLQRPRGHGEHGSWPAESLYLPVTHASQAPPSGPVYLHTWDAPIIQQKQRVNESQDGFRHRVGRHRSEACLARSGARQASLCLCQRALAQAQARLLTAGGPRKVKIGRAFV